jgi:hypothetical protein
LSIENGILLDFAEQVFEDDQEGMPVEVSGLELLLERLPKMLSLAVLKEHILESLEAKPINVVLLHTKRETSQHECEHAMNIQPEYGQPLGECLGLEEVVFEGGELAGVDGDAEAGQQATRSRRALSG